MSYIVVYQKADGSSGLEECVDLDLAIVTAERLRNVDAVERPRIFQTEEIRYDFKPYYRVEMAAEGTTSTVDDMGFADPMASSLSADPFTADSSSADRLAADRLSVDALLNEPIEPAAPVADASESLGDFTAESSEVDSAAEESALDHDLFKAEAPVAEDLTPPEVPSSGGGLFGVPNDASDAADIADVVEETAPSVEADPPRRGLFGR